MPDARANIATLADTIACSRAPLGQTCLPASGRRR
jgi:hypothetical protein